MIAFDDFKLSYSQCSTGQYSQECYFEGSDCGLKISHPFLTPNWKETNGKSTSVKVVDHTLQTNYGSFYAIDYTQKQNSVTSSFGLDSNVLFKPTAGSCVTFWYLITELTTNQQLKFGYKITDQSEPKIVWSAIADQGPFWYIHKETIVSPGKEWKIYFQADNIGNKGIIAIDDITVDTKNPCKGTSGNINN